MFLARVAGYLTKEESVACMKERQKGEGSSGRSNRRRHPRHGSSSGNGGVNCSISVGGRDVSKDTCNLSKPKRVVAHIAQGEDDESILLMATVRPSTYDLLRSMQRTCHGHSFRNVGAGEPLPSPCDPGRGDSLLGPYNLDAGELILGCCEPATVAWTRCEHAPATLAQGSSVPSVATPPPTATPTDAALAQLSTSPVATPVWPGALMMLVEERVFT